MKIYGAAFFSGTTLWMLIALFAFPAHSSVYDSTTINIGILADTGKETCHKRWDLTAVYLTSQLPEYKAQIVCLNFDEFEQAMQDKLLDFTISNPSVYVNLAYDYGVSRIATANAFHHQFGGVIFYKADRHDINSVEDFKKKTFMAVAEDSFGGWQAAWRYLKERGIDPHKDFKKLLFAGRHDAVVMEVLSGRADAGTVRTNTLERMAAEGKIDLSDFEIFDPQEMTPQFSFLRTTRLYPEWPLAKVQHTPLELAKKVAIIMMQMPPDGVAARTSLSGGWTIPLDYHLINEALQVLRVAPYERFGTLTYRQLYQQYRNWILITVIFLFCTFVGLTVSFILNKKLHSALAALEAEHQQRAAVVADLEEFKLTLDQTLDCVFMFSADSLQYIYANQGALNHLGYSLEELLTMTPFDVKPDLTEDQFRSMLAPLKKRPETSLTYTTKHRRKDGTIVPVEIFLQHITPPEKQGRFVSILRDITIRQQKEAEKEHLQKKLLQEQKLASVGQLAAGIAHEINTPAQYLGSNIDFLNETFAEITNLITQYEQLLELAKDQAVAPQLISTIEHSIEEMDWPYLKEEIPQAITQSLEGVQQVSSIVLAMKNFSHPGSTEKELTDLNKLILTTLTVSRSEWKLILDPILQLDPQVPPVQCLRNEIGQVFLNIIINAAHSIAEKQGEDGKDKKGKLTITSTRSNDAVVLTLSDTGAGITRENLAKIFDPFFTTKAVGKGTGQGLAISHDIIINKHKGTLDVESEEGAGTTFTITLPISSPP